MPECVELLPEQNLAIGERISPDSASRDEVRESLRAALLCDFLERSELGTRVGAGTRRKRTASAFAKTPSSIRA
jgi:hypothetical protein